MSSAQRPLAGRAALVTGAARGLGRGFALRLAALGADVAICDIDLKGHLEFEDERAQVQAGSVSEEIQALGVDACAFENDAADFDAQREVVRTIAERWGRLDVVVCNAGGSVGLPGVSVGPSMFASSIDPVELDLIIRRNLVATISTCVAVSPKMKAQRSGSIVTIGSITGLQALPDGKSAPYGAAKAAVTAYTRYLAQELGPFGVRVNCIAPGVTETGRMRSVYNQSNSEAMGMRESTVAARNPLGRIGQVEDCVNAMEFLCTDASSFVTGHVLAVDGGEVRGPT